MPRADEGINAPGLLLCEGRDDFAFFLAMCSFLRISGETIWIERLGGRGELHDLLNGLPIRDSRKRLRAIGIVSDADGPDDGAESFRRIRDDLRNTGYTAPAQALEIASGPWGGGSSLSVGVYIMPDNQMTGALEDLCLAAISEDPSLRCVDDYLNCVSVAGSISWRTQDRSKARLNAWLV